MPMVIRYRVGVEVLGCGKGANEWEESHEPSQFAGNDGTGGHIYGCIHTSNDIQSQKFVNTLLRNLKTCLVRLHCLPRRCGIRAFPFDFVYISTHTRRLGENCALFSKI